MVEIKETPKPTEESTPADIKELVSYHYDLYANWEWLMPNG